ncbi:MAG: polysaccharide deacetylase family protein [Bacilli bacterium]|nr:polysaccharide deacetylase family protein [Bacilli bacterium]
MEVNVVTKRRINKTFLLFLFLNFLVLFVLWGIYLCFAQIDLKGDRNITLNYKEKYKEKGYNASRFGKSINNEVKVKGKVNSDKLGTYEVVYEVPGLFGKKVVRTIEVVDNEKPNIIIDATKKIYLCPGSKYVKEEVQVRDNYDGDISKKLVIESDDKKVTYSVKDSSGNKTKVVRDIVYEDKTSPVISLNGDRFNYVFLNEGYNDSGAVANDNCEGDISNKIVVSNKVNINSVGSYEVIYTVSDSSGNTASISRTVRVSERNKAGTVYLTFDDGPQWGTTDKILDILKEEGVEATFFVTNKGPDELIKRMYDEGHTVALHTASHNYATVYASVDSYFNDLNSVKARVKRITGYDATIIRFPGGSSNTISRNYSVGIMSTLTKEVVNRGYKYYDWNISSGDAAGGPAPTPTQIKNNVVNALRKDRINMVLMHDIKTYTRDALRDIIRFGKDNGYTFEKITMDTTMVKQRVNN